MFQFKLVVNFYYFLIKKVMKHSNHLIRLLCIQKPFQIFYVQIDTDALFIALITTGGALVKIEGPHRNLVKGEIKYCSNFACGFRSRFPNLNNLFTMHESSQITSHILCHVLHWRNKITKFGSVVGGSSWSVNLMKKSAPAIQSPSFRYLCPCPVWLDCL